MVKPWIEKKEDWLGRGKKASSPAPAVRRAERMFSVSEVADLLSVTRQTVFKWLALDEPEEAVIPPEAWVRLPGSGHIRIKEWAVVKLQAGGV